MSCRVPTPTRPPAKHFHTLQPHFLLLVFRLSKSIYICPPLASSSFILPPPISLTLLLNWLSGTEGSAGSCYARVNPNVLVGLGPLFTCCCSCLTNVTRVGVLVISPFLFIHRPTARTALGLLCPSIVPLMLMLSYAPFQQSSLLCDICCFLL